MPAEGVSDTISTNSVELRMVPAHNLFNFLSINSLFQLEKLVAEFITFYM